MRRTSYVLLNFPLIALNSNVMPSYLSFQRAMRVLGDVLQALIIICAVFKNVFRDPGFGLFGARDRGLQRNMGAGFGIAFMDGAWDLALL